MRARILAIGRLRDRQLGALIDFYLKQLHGGLAITEIEARKRVEDSERRLVESRLLADAIPDGAIRIILDEQGVDEPSRDFARRLEAWQALARPICFIIGGPDGITAEFRASADHLMALGRRTWPHMLARLLLVEQIYRARQIITGHPYHRDG